MTTNPFKNSMGARLTKALFLEMAYTTPGDEKRCLYTLKDQDHNGLPSLYRLYMSCSDPTEYTFATTYLDGLEHWEILCECPWFKPFVERWRREFSLRSQSQALVRIMDVAKDPSHRSNYEANKYLLESKWKPTEAKSGRGRPSKAEVKKAAVAELEAQQMISDDLERIKSLQ